MAATCPRAPAALRIRPPPMLADLISPDCYNFTVGNWRKQEFYSPNYPGEYLNNTDCVLYLEDSLHCLHCLIPDSLHCLIPDSLHCLIPDSLHCLIPDSLHCLIPDSLHCLHCLIPAPPGFTIQLDFRDQFALEQSDDCKYDFLEVRDGPFAYSPLIDRFCGAGYPPLIESTDRFLWLRFKADDLLQYDGFKAIYSYYKDHTQDDATSLSKVMSTVCRIPIKLGADNPDGVLTSQEVPFGDVSDPNYPRNRPVDCTWEISTEQGNSIHLQTLKMARGGGSNPARCDISYVALYQATTLTADRRARLCGDLDPKLEPEAMALTTGSNRVFVRLYGHALNHKPELEMVYSLVRTGEACSKNAAAHGLLSCGDFCIGQELRCNGVPNCPDARDERGCPPGTGPGRKGPGGRGSKPAGGSSGGGEDGGGGNVRGGGGSESDGDEDDGEEKSAIPLHMIILGAVGGVVFTCVCLSLCVMCRSRRRHARKKRQEEQKARETSKRQQNLEMTTPTPSTASQTPHPTHSLSRPGAEKEGTRPGIAKGQGQGQGQPQGQPQGRYMTFAHVTPSRKDDPHRYSFTGQMPEGGGGGCGESGEVPDSSGQYRRFLNLEMTPDPLDDPYPQMYPSQGGGILGMTHLPSPTSPSITSLPQSPLEGVGPYAGKYQNQWAKGMMEDPNAVYPYTSSLPRPTPFLGLSKPFQAESKYLKSMQALKVMDEEIMKDSPAS
ncbi:hypothetical protein ACOMHN_052312 [Nucella lapillus]